MWWIVCCCWEANMEHFSSETDSGYPSNSESCAADFELLKVSYDSLSAQSKVKLAETSKNLKLHVRFSESLQIDVAIYENFGLFHLNF